MGKVSTAVCSGFLHTLHGATKGAGGASAPCVRCNVMYRTLLAAQAAATVRILGNKTSTGGEHLCNRGSSWYTMGRRDNDVWNWVKNRLASRGFCANKFNPNKTLHPSQLEIFLSRSGAFPRQTAGTRQIWRSCTRSLAGKRKNRIFAAAP